MIKNILILFSIYFLTACSTDKIKSITENEMETKKKDSVDYTFTGKAKIWITSINKDKDTVDIYFREVKFENKTKGNVQIPIPHVSFSTEGAIYHDTVLESRIIGGCKTEDYCYKKSSTGKLIDCGWGSISCCGFGNTTYSIKPNSSETFYMLSFTPNITKAYEDSFVYMVTYTLDSIHYGGKRGFIKKNFYTSKNELIEIDHFVSLDNIYKRHK